MTANNQRISWADSIKGFSAICVVLYHAAVQPEVKTLAYIVCLPAFFFVAGLFAHSDSTPGLFFRRKTIRLLIPYVIFGVLSWGIWMVLRHFGKEDAQTESWWLPLWGIASGKVELLVQNRPLWFLCCMIGTEWIYYALCRVPHKSVRWFGSWLIAALGCVLALFGKTGIWEITAAMLVVPLYVLGAEGRSFFLTRFTHLSYTRLAVLFIASVLAIGIGFFLNPTFHISTCQVGNPLFFYVTAFGVIGFWLTLGVMLDKCVGKVRWLSYLGQNTLIILCTHIPLFGFIKGVSMACGLPLSFYTTNIGSLTLWLSSLFLLFPLIYIINRFFPFLIGKKRITP